MTGLYAKINIALDPQTSIGKLFSKVYSAQSSCNIAYFSVNQTTLEQIFQNFAKETEQDLDKLSHDLVSISNHGFNQIE